MLDGTYFFECDCGGDEHTLRFTLDKEDGMYTSVFLHQWRSWYVRLWVAIKYLFGYKCKYGHWDCWTMRDEDADSLLNMIHSYKRLRKLR